MKKLLLIAVLAGLAFTSFSFVNKPPSPSVSKSLIFPVGGKRSSIGSFWGDVRDGGRRKHEGIDIFAKKGTPVLAICDGFIVSKGNTPRGGKTLWLQAVGHPWSVYYAHLDEQKVRRGQFVRKGQVIGTVGNTGNARTTPPHLHFGMYSWTGAINPLPYVKHSPKISPALPKPEKPAVAKVSTEKKKTAITGIDKKYIWKTLSIPADPAAQYYVTVRSNVVRIDNGKLQVVGKWQKAGGKYPYKIALINKQQVYVDKTGKLLAANGAQIGKVM